MIAVSRFRVSEDEAAGFAVFAEPAAAFFRARPGCQRADLVQNLDDPTLWALVSHWDDVGSYRRGFNGYEAKMVLTPVLSLAVDEPSAYAPAEEVGTNQPRET
ncbi:MAG: antibiotic biosynthesis monooxygenase family protein [Propioniciclava sp.]